MNVTPFCVSPFLSPPINMFLLPSALPLIMFLCPSPLPSTCFSIYLPSPQHVSPSLSPPPQPLSPPPPLTPLPSPSTALPSLSTYLPSPSTPLPSPSTTLPSPSTPLLSHPLIAVCMCTFPQNVGESPPLLAPELLTVSSDTRNSSVQSIVAIEGDSTVWCATGNAIIIVDTE